METAELQAISNRYKRDTYEIRKARTNQMMAEYEMVKFLVESQANDLLRVDWKRVNSYLNNM